MINIVEKREKSLTEFIVIIILLTLLMAILINYFFQQEEQITETGFNNLAQNFSNTILTVHAQWMMENKPNVVSISSFNNKNVQIIFVNNKGWVDAKESDLSCENIWLSVMAIPLTLMKLSIVAVEVRHNVSNNFRQCRYVLSSGHFFDYSSATGKVSEIKKN